MDIYSSGLTLLTLGLPAPRWVAAAIDGVLMILGAIYIVWISGSDFIYVFEGFLITLGVPMAAWCGVFLADLLLRRRDYDETALFDVRGRYGAVGLPAVVSMVVAAVVGWGLVVAPFGSKGLGWLGYFLEPFGLGGKTGTWAFANLGVPVALAVGFVGYLLLGAWGVTPPGARPAAAARLRTALRRDRLARQPIVVSSPCPVWTTVSSGSGRSRALIDSTIRSPSL